VPLSSLRPTAWVSDIWASRSNISTVALEYVERVSARHHVTVVFRLL
jgi:hypothetical protein